MANETKACNLTESEIEVLIFHYGHTLSDGLDSGLERLNYLNKRLKAFKEPEETKPAVVAGWGTPAKE